MTNFFKKQTYKKVVIIGCLFIFYFAFYPLSLVYADETVTISANVGGIPPPTTPSGGGGGSVIIPTTAVRFSGYAYPLASVYLLKDGKQVAEVTADSTGIFSMTLPEKYDSTILYTLFAIDKDLNKSLLLNYPIAVYSGYVTHLSGIRFSPTLLADKSEVNFADSVKLYGNALPQEDLELVLNKKNDSDGFSEQKETFDLKSKSDGSYSFDLSVLGMAKGDYSLYIKYKSDSKFSKTVFFSIGDVSRLNTVNENIPGDCNFDNVINLVDFSILAFWYKKPSPPVCIDTNKDKEITLVDFSILAFYWNG